MCGYGNHIGGQCPSEEPTLLDWVKLWSVVIGVCAGLGAVVWVFS